jgi:hypothetical protein
MTDVLQEVEGVLKEDGIEVEFVINELYTQRIQELINHAKRHRHATSEQAYRMLQILTTLRGGLTF